MRAVPAVLRRTLDAATHEAVLRHAAARTVWTRLLGTRRIPEPERVRLARRVASRLQEAGQADAAAALLAGVAAGLRNHRAAADLTCTAANLTLARGEVPAGLPESLAAVLAVADSELRAGRMAAAAEQLARALGLAFHRTLHFDSARSPLADDPERFLAPMRGSAAYRRVVERRTGRASAAVPPPAGRPHRVLFVSYRNWSFVDDIVAHVEANPAAEVRRLDLADLPGLPLSVLQQARLRLAGPADTRALPWAAPIVEQLDWADTVFVEWGQRGAALVSTLDPGTARVIVRLHSFEAFTAFPHLVDWSRVDDLVVVAPHMREFVRQAVPLAPTEPRIHVVSNHLRLRGFRRDKPAESRHTLAVVGYAAPAKDAVWAIDLLARLRRHSPQWRLLLVGHDIAADAPAGVRRYADRITARMTEPDVRGAVEQVPFTPDIAEFLRRVGVMVSSSVRESFHLALVEGAASGAVPVVRNWPMFARYGGARTLFPPEWVVDDVDAAARRILDSCADEAGWRAAGAAAADQVAATFDWDHVGPSFDELLFAPAPARSA